jgi:hypothetical protein
VTGGTFVPGDANQVGWVAGPIGCWGIDGRTQFASAGHRRSTVDSNFTPDRITGFCDTISAAGAIAMDVKWLDTNPGGNNPFGGASGIIWDKQWGISQNNRMMLRYYGATTAFGIEYGGVWKITSGVYTLPGNIQHWTTTDCGYNPTRRVVCTWNTGTPAAGRHKVEVWVDSVLCGYEDTFTTLPALTTPQPFAVGGNSYGAVDKNTAVEWGNVVAVNYQPSRRDILADYQRRMPMANTTSYDRLATRYRINAHLGDGNAQEFRMMLDPIQNSLVAFYSWENTVGTQGQERVTNVLGKPQDGNVGFWTRSLATGTNSFNCVHGHYVWYAGQGEANATLYFLGSGRVWTSPDGNTWNGGTLVDGNGVLPGVVTPDLSPDGQWWLYDVITAGTPSSYLGVWFRGATPATTWGAGQVLPTDPHLQWGTGKSMFGGDQIVKVGPWYYAMGHVGGGFILPTYGHLCKSLDLVHWLPDPGGLCLDFPPSQTTDIANQYQVADLNYLYFGGVSYVTFSAVTGDGSTSNIMMSSFAGTLDQLWAPALGVAAQNTTVGASGNVAPMKAPTGGSGGGSISFP